MLILSLIQHTRGLKLSSVLPILCQVQKYSCGLSEGERKVIGEDSWIMDLYFVTSYFHSFATEERLNKLISKEQLTLTLQSQ